MGRLRDRQHAGRLLGEEVARASAAEGWPRPIVFGLARGGVPVAALVAEALGAPLEVLVVRKLGVPAQPEVAMGALAEAAFAGGSAVVVWNDDVVRAAAIDDRARAEVLDRELAAARARVDRFRDGRSPSRLDGRTAVVVDDGVATGATARAAIALVHALGATSAVLATPVASVDALRDLRGDAEIVCLLTPEPFLAVGAHYDDFDQTSDDEVAAILARGRPDASSAEEAP
ncbi:phosphoribosyltransferase [Agromyces soli]